MVIALQPNNIISVDEFIVVLSGFSKTVRQFIKHPFINGRCTTMAVENAPTISRSVVEEETAVR